jgi:SAM-dependent methyltransferase
MDQPTLEAYFATTTADPAQIDWRLSCYRAGSELVQRIERDYFPVAGRKVLDLACGWGGHALAFAAAGADVTASDLNDQGFTGLQRLCDREGLLMKVFPGDCQRLPLDDQYDVILALDLIEHIPSPPALAAEVRRLLKPGGVCILTTPAKLLSALWKEPHWQLKWLSLLPFAWQRPIAQGVFKRSYPFPIERQYLHAAQIQRVFGGFKCTPIPATRKLPFPSLFWGHLELQRALD